MSGSITAETLYWADTGDNRIGPLLRELIEALADTNDPHLVKAMARRIHMLSSSLNSMAHRMAENHERKDCPICKHGSVFVI
jgi:hypothetical protein